MASGLHCPACGNFQVVYDSSTKTTRCGVCKLTKTIEPKKANCCSCGKEYVEFTWFDPSGCKYCRKSFVE